jgi:hypothetical protein
MNHRIKELAEQSGIQEDLVDHLKDEVEVLTYIARPQDIQKFVELIIKECANIVKPTSNHEAFAQNYLGGVDGLELLDSKIKNIKQHFGVE